MKIVEGSLFEADTKYIVHQCNCLTLRGGHLAKSMFETFPYADIYKTRERGTDWREARDKPGTIEIRGNGEDERFVINAIAQVFPGSPRYPESKADGSKAREAYFQECLNDISKIEDLESIGFPYGIGCGAAGGDWSSYLSMIEDFDKLFAVDVVLYKID